ncbi:MAG: aspartate aminotransferase family protein [Candidatus Bathyarchaeia archaeon]
MKKPNFGKSRALFERARKVIPGGTNSAARGIVSGGMFDGYPIEYPRFVKEAKGSHIVDVDGNQFIDYHLAFGPVILGHAYPSVNEAVKKQLDIGVVHGLNHEVEVELSEKINKYVPCADMVRILNTGSAATSAAVRMARMYTGKEKILKFEGHYHGWHDWDMPNLHLPSGFYVRGRFLDAGVPLSELENVIPLAWNDLNLVEKTLRRQGNEIAAIITEPYLFNSGVIAPEKGYLEGLRKLTTEYDIVLIFDEVITGFRLGLSGGQGMLGVTPDLATFAKAMANGFTISAVAGKREIMEKVGTVIGGTYNANPISTTAALATITELEKKESYDHIYRVSRVLMNGLRDAIEDVAIEAVVQGPGPGFGLYLTDLERIKSPLELLAEKKHPHTQRNVVFHQEMVNRGVFIMPNARGARIYLSVSHTEEDMKKTIEAAEESFKEAKRIK